MKPLSPQSTTASPSPTLTLMVVAAVQFLGPFLATSMNVALPSIGRDLGAGAVQLSLTITIYILASSIALLPMGRLADIHGRKKIFITGTIILALAVLGAGMVRSIRILLLLRFVQGIGYAMITSSSFAILSAVFPAERRGRAMGIATAMVYFGSSFGPFLSGLIITHLGWQWIFFITSGCLAAALMMTLLFLKGEWANAAGEPFDYLGAWIFMVALCLLVLSASSWAKHHSAVWGAAAGLAGLLIFAAVELKTRYPLLDFRLLRSNPSFSFSNLATFLNYAALTGFVFLFSLYLQYVKGFSPKTTGLLMIAQPLAQAILSPVAGRLSDAYPPTRIATIGTGLCTVGLFAAALMTPATSIPYIVMVTLLLGISLGLFSSSNMTTIMNSVGPRHYGTASSMVATMRNMGFLVSSTTIAVILSFHLGNASVTHQNIGQYMISMKTSLYIFTLLSVIGTLFSMVKGRLTDGIAGHQGRTP